MKKQRNENLIGKLAMSAMKLQTLKENYDICLRKLENYKAFVGAECMLPEEEVVKRCIEIVRNSFDGI